MVIGQPKKSEILGRRPQCNRTQSGPLVRVAVKEPIRTSLDEGNPIFLGLFRDFRRRFGCYRNSLEGVDGGPCRDRTYDQLIKSQLLYQLS